MESNRMIRVIENDDDQPVSLMLQTAVSTVKSILGRLDVEYEHGLPKEVYVTALNDRLLEDKGLIPMMVPEYMIRWLEEIWDEEQVYLDEERMNYLEYLKIFGFAMFCPGSRKKGTEDTVLISKARKEEFYFFLRSRSAREELRAYSRWEKLITGMMYYYGFLEIRVLYELFLRSCSRIVSYDTFLQFVKCRCSLWAFGEILKDIHRDVDYFSWCEVDNRETLLLYIREHGDIPYKKVEYEDLVYISDGAGIDNRWPGITELGTLLVNDAQMDYYQTTMEIRMLIRMVHNGSPLERLVAQKSRLPLKSPKQEEAYEKAVKMLYESVPVFEYKGYSRGEYRRLFYEKQLKKRTAIFKIIDGGRDATE